MVIYVDIGIGRVKGLDIKALGNHIVLSKTISKLEAHLGYLKDVNII